MKFSDFKEVNHTIAAILILTAVIGLSFVINSQWLSVLWAFIFAAIIIFVHVFAKKLTAHLLDADVEHSLWSFARFGLKPHQKLETQIPAGIIFPLALTLFTLGKFKLMTLLTYEARALKVRAAKRFGFYSYTELTEWHNALIGAGGIIALLILSFISYFPGFEYLSKMAAYYAFCNMLPISKLDGTQIFFGSRILWTALALITIIFTAYALILPF